MNNIKLKKSLMAVAAGAALATVGMGAANASSLLFPYFSTQGGASSYLLLRSGALTGNPSQITGTPVSVGTVNQRVNGGNIHYVWNTFPAGTTLSGGAMTCTHIDAYGSMTAHDTMFQELSSPTGVPFKDGSVPAFLPPQGGATQGFLIVSDTTAPDVATGAAGSLTGQMIVADPTTGSLYAYNGIASSSTQEGNFSGITATNFGLAWYPQGVTNGGAFSTKWYALAVGNENTAILNQANWASNYNNDKPATYGGTGGNTLMTASVASAYDNDENPVYSGTNPGLTVGCATTFTPSSLLTATNAALLAPTGGQMTLTFNTTGSIATGVVLTKIDAVQLGSGVNWTQGGAVLFTQENNLTPAVNAASAPL